MDKEQRENNNSSNSSSSASSASSASSSPAASFNNNGHRSTLHCILCGGKQIYPGPRYKNHLVNEHGVALDLAFLLQISLFKRDKGALPEFSPSLDPLPRDAANDDEAHEDNKDNKGEEDHHKRKKNASKSYKSMSTQTDIAAGELACVKCSDPVQESSEDEELDEEGGRKEEGGLIPCWFCPNCPKVFRKSAHLKEHALEVHKSSLDKEEVEGILPKRMTEEEYYQQRHGIPVVYYNCYFCKELFRGDHRLKKHLHTEHKKESFAEMVRAKEELRKVRDARKKSMKCSLCGTGHITETEFEKHLLSVHNLTKAQYQEEFGKGSSDIPSKIFKCELCDEEIEHVRETIVLHMKNTHLISWTEYQEILLKSRREDTGGGESIGAEPPFDCLVCGERRIKSKKDHLRKKHQMSNEIYDKLLGHRTGSQAKMCLLCENETQDLRRHLERIHRVSYESYIELTSESKEDDDVVTNGGMNSHSLRCRYGCEDVFNKEYQLYLHLRLKHDSYEGGEEEDGMNSGKKGLDEKCYLCNMRFYDAASLMAHISSAHDASTKDSNCNNESLNSSKNASPSNNNSIGGSFECKLCNRNFKYDRTAINDHLQTAHGLNWLGYLDRIRVKAECKICDTSVKNLKEHLLTVHKMTEKEYEAREADKSMNHSTMSMDQQSLSQSADDFLAVETNIPKPPKSDIQNKTNKTCSSCTITFASRRNFIEHCTTVHNMKFKTKSGLTIQAPKSNNSSGSAAAVVNRKPVSSVAHQLTPSVTIKRKLDSNSNTNFSPPNPTSNPSLLKRPRIDGGNDLSSIIPQLPQHPLPQAAVIEPVEKTLGSHYQTTGVSRWNQCKYQCCFCKKTTQSRSSMTSHIANTHGIPIKEYKERNYPDIEVVTNWFQCRLCSTKTKFVKDCISPHLKMSHSIDIEDYERQYMRPEDWPNCQKPAGGTKSEMRNSEISTNRSLLKSTTIQSSPSHPSDEESEKKKWNKCRFQCKICQLITIDARQMRVHISNAHKLSYDNYVAQYGSSEIVTKKFRCELCSSEMKFCRQNIYAHMKDVHKITLSEYEGRVGYVPPPDDDDLDESPEHIVINSDVATTKPYDDGADGNDETTSSPATPSQNADHFTSKWNKCRYKCQICQRVTSEKPVIRDHILKQHGFDLEDYESQYGDVEVVTEYFTCSICNAEVKHCHRNISLHLQKVHNMTTSEYEEAMGQNDSKDNGEIGGFGAHFLLDSNSSDSSSPTRRPASNGPPIRPPPREDIINPKNKYCMPCNRDFNRRQAFVEHCRNVHRMTINFTRESGKAETEETAGQVQIVHPSVVTVTTTPGSLNCDYCGKQFSNRSNRNRHMLLSCEVVKAGGVPRTPHQQMIAEDGGSIKCPMTDCDFYFSEGSSLSAHLTDVHGISSDRSEDDEDRLKIASPESTKDHHHNTSRKSGEENAEEVKVEFRGDEDDEGEVDAEEFMDTSGEIHKEDEAPSSSPGHSVKQSKEDDEDDDDSDDDSDSESDDDSDDSDSDSDSDEDEEQKNRESDN